MKKIKIALAVALPAVIVLLAVFFVCSFSLKNMENDVGAAFAAVIIILANVGSVIACIPFAAAFLVFEILLFTAKKQTRVAIALLIVMSILLPILGFVLILDATVISSLYSSLFIGVMVVLALGYLLTYVLSILYLISCRKAAAEAKA